MSEKNRNAAPRRGDEIGPWPGLRLTWVYARVSRHENAHAGVCDISQLFFQYLYFDERVYRTM